MLRTKRQLDRGSIFSGVGLVLYLVCLQVQAPAVATYGLLAVFSVVALWTEVSMLTYPKEDKDTDINYNNLWGQSAMTLLLAGSGVMTLVRALGL